MPTWTFATITLTISAAMTADRDPVAALERSRAGLGFGR